MGERKPFNLPVYDKFYKIRLQSEQKVKASDVIIVEGALIFCSEELRNMFDLSLFIDTDDDVSEGLSDDEVTTATHETRGK